MRLTLEAHGIVVVEGSWEGRVAQEIMQNSTCGCVPADARKEQTFNSFDQFVSAMVEHKMPLVKLDGNIFQETKIENDKVVSQPKIRILFSAYTHQLGLFRYETIL